MDTLDIQTPYPQMKAVFDTYGVIFNRPLSH